MYSLTLSFYGITVLLTSDTQEIIKDIERDYSFFMVQESIKHFPIPLRKSLKVVAKGDFLESEVVAPQIIINAHNVQLPYDTLPSMQASYISPRNTCYYSGGIKYIDYPGKGLVIYNKTKSKSQIYSTDYHLLHEICYMTILSLVNEKLDRYHIHRVHGLGLSINNKAILILLDMGGGKTTLAMDILMSDNDIKLISEDSPLIDTRGRILPFPSRIGLNPTEVPSGIPDEYQRYFERQEFGPKILIDIECFRNKICNYPCQPHIVIIGRRVLNKESEIKPSSKYQALKEFIKNSVIGVGLYQGIEYVFEKGPKEVVKKIPLGLSRLNNALKVIDKSKIFEILLGPDKEKNSRTLKNFFAEEIRNIKE